MRELHSLIVSLLLALTAFLLAVAPAEAGTKHIFEDGFGTGGDCALMGGAWDGPSKTCTLTTDVHDPLIIGGDGITLDGGRDIGVTLDGGGVGLPGVMVSGRAGVRIKNLHVTGFSTGVLIYNSNATLVSGSLIAGNSVFGVAILSSSGIGVWGNSIGGNGYSGLFSGSDSDPDGDGVPNSADCSDGDSTISHAEVEVCIDAVDNDCDGLVDSADADCIMLKDGDVLWLDTHPVFVVVDPLTGVQKPVRIAPGSRALVDIAVEANRDVLVLLSGVNPTPTIIARVALEIASNAQSTVSSGGLLGGGGPMAIGSEGNILVAAEQSVLRVDPVTGAQATVSLGGLLTGTAEDMSVETTGDALVLVQEGPQGRIVRVDAVTGSQSTVWTSPFPEAVGSLAVEESGDILVGVREVGVIRIDAVSGTETILATGGLLSWPTGIAVERNGGILVTERDNAALVRVDAVTGAQMLVSDGGAFFSPQDLTIFSSDMDRDGIHNDVDDDPFLESKRFSDFALGGITSGRILGLDTGITVEITDGPDPATGVRVLVSGPAVGEARIKIDGSAGTYKLTPGEYILTSGSLTLEVLEGRAEVEFVVGGAQIVVELQGTVVFNETLEDGELLEVEMLVLNGIVTVNGTHVNPGDSLLIPIPILIDIKPGSDSNCVNNDGHGVIPVAILSDGDFDATEVDPSRVRLETLVVKSPGRSGKLLAHVEDVNGDGFDDLVAKMEDSEGAFQADDTIATLTGSLLPQFGGTPIKGEDFICLVGQ